MPRALHVPGAVASVAVLSGLLSWCGRRAPVADAQTRADAAPRRYVAMAGGDARHTGRVDARGPHREPSILWRVRTQRRVFASPAVDRGGRAVFGSLDGSVLAVDGAGVVRWAFTAPDRVFGAPAISGDLTVFGHDGDRYVAVDARGLERWSFHAGGDADAPPVVGPDGAVYVASHEAASLDAEGRARWTTPLPGHAFGAPALSPDGNLFVTVLSGTVMVLRASDGSVLRRIDLPTSAHAGVLVLDDGSFVVGTDDGHVRSYANDGRARWDFTTRGAREALGVRAMPALGRDGTVVVGADDGCIYGLRAADGTEAFRVTTSLPVRSSARVDADGWIFVGAEDDTLRALEPSGAVAWSVVLGSDIDGSPAILPDGTLVVGADDGALYALR